MPISEVHLAFQDLYTRISMKSEQVKRRGKVDLIINASDGGAFDWSMDVIIGSILGCYLRIVFKIV